MYTFANILTWSQVIHAVGLDVIMFIYFLSYDIYSFSLKIPQGSCSQYYQNWPKYSLIFISY